MDFLQLEFSLSSHLPIECQLIIFSVSCKSEDSISFFSLLCLLFLLIFNDHWISQLHNCILLIHSTFYLFHHQTCSLCILDLCQTLKTAVESQGMSVCLMQRPGQPKPICTMRTAETATFQYEQQTTDTNMPKMWRYPEKTSYVKGFRSSCQQMLQMCFYLASSYKSGASFLSTVDMKLSGKESGYK